MGYITSYFGSPDTNAVKVYFFPKISKIWLLDKDSPCLGDALRSQLNKPFFIEIIILGSWAIWMSRNNKIFRQIDASFHSGKVLFLSEMDALLLRAKNS